MTPIRTFTVALPPAPSTARCGDARVEKISLSNKPDGERDDNPAPQSFADAKLARMPAFQNETSDGVSEMDEARLVPAFVTQVLAQITGSSAPDAISALVAYGHSHPQIARVYDRGA